MCSSHHSLTLDCPILAVRVSPAKTWEQYFEVLRIFWKIPQFLNSCVNHRTATKFWRGENDYKTHFKVHTVLNESH